MACGHRLRTTKSGGGGVVFDEGVVVDGVSMGLFATLLSAEDEVEQIDLSERVDLVELERWTMPIGSSNFWVSSASMLTWDKGWVIVFCMYSAMMR